MDLLSWIQNFLPGSSRLLPKERLSWGRTCSVPLLGRQFLWLAGDVSVLTWTVTWVFSGVCLHHLYSSSGTIAAPRQTVPMVVLEMLSWAQRAVSTCAALPGVYLPVDGDTWSIASSSTKLFPISPFSLCILGHNLPTLCTLHSFAVSGLSAPSISLVDEELTLSSQCFHTCAEERDFYLQRQRSQIYELCEGWAGHSDAIPWKQAITFIGTVEEGELEHSWPVAGIFCSLIIAVDPQAGEKPKLKGSLAGQ